jgi:hypothetical protein
MFRAGPQPYLQTPHVKTPTSQQGMARGGPTDELISELLHETCTIPCFAQGCGSYPTCTSFPLEGLMQIVHFQLQLLQEVQRSSPSFNLPRAAPTHRQVRCRTLPRSPMPIARGQPYIEWAPGRPCKRQHTLQCLSTHRTPKSNTPSLIKADGILKGYQACCTGTSNPWVCYTASTKDGALD